MLVEGTIAAYPVPAQSGEVVAVAGATAASTRMFDQGNFVQRGMLTRLAWSDPGGGWAAWVFATSDGFVWLYNFVIG